MILKYRIFFPFFSHPANSPSPPNVLFKQAHTRDHINLKEYQIYIQTGSCSIAFYLSVFILCFSMATVPSFAGCGLAQAHWDFEC